VRHRFQRVRLHYNKHAPRASQRVSARHARGVNGPLERRTVDSLVTVAAGNKNRVRKCSAMHYTMQKVDECVATRDDDREWISTFPLPPIPIHSIHIPSIQFTFLPIPIPEERKLRMRTSLFVPNSSSGVTATL